MKKPPYQLIADIGSILLVIFVLLAYRFYAGRMPEWTFTLAWTVAALVLLSSLTELWLMWRDYRAGTLFPMRNASLFILLFTLLGLPAYLVYGELSGLDIGPSTYLLVPVFLAFAVRNLFRFRMDQVTVQAKTGFRAPTEVPLFNIREVAADDRKITIEADGHRPIHLLRTFFFPSHWRVIRSRLASLPASGTGSNPAGS